MIKAGYGREAHPSFTATRPVTKQQRLRRNLRQMCDSVKNRRISGRARADNGGSVMFAGFLIMRNKKENDSHRRESAGQDAAK